MSVHEADFEEEKVLFDFTQYSKTKKYTLLGSFILIVSGMILGTAFLSTLLITPHVHHIDLDNVYVYYGLKTVGVITIFSALAMIIPPLIAFVVTMGKTSAFSGVSITKQALKGLGKTIVTILPLSFLANIILFWIFGRPTPKYQDSILIGFIKAGGWIEIVLYIILLIMGLLVVNLTIKALVKE